MSKNSNKDDPPIPVPDKMNHLKNRESRKDANWNKEADEIFRKYKKTIKKDGKEDLYYVTNPIADRRVKAAANYAPKVISRYSKAKFSDSFKSQMGMYWLHLNLEKSEGYDTLESESKLLLAAAIWILDQITSQPKWQRKLYPILPADKEILNSLDKIAIWDPSYAEELIYSVVYVLVQRNNDSAGKSNESVQRVFTSSLAAKNKHPENSANRETYEKIINLIPSQAIENAVERFQKLFWLWLDRFYSCLSLVVKPLDDSIEKANTKIDEYNDLREEVSSLMVESRDRHTKMRSSILDSLTKNKNLQDSIGLTEEFHKMFSSSADLTSDVKIANDWVKTVNILSNGPVRDVMQLVDRVVDLEQKALIDMDEVNEGEKQVHDFLADITAKGFIEEKLCEEKYGAPVSNVMKPLPIGDPYELCFALLWLIESGSDLPWLFGVGTNLMKEIAGCLPWSIQEYDGKYDTTRYNENMSENNDSMHGLGAKNNIEIPDLYKRRYRPKNEFDGYDIPRNLTQIVYEETGSTLPRDMNRFLYIAQDLNKYNLTKKDALSMFYLISVILPEKNLLKAENLDENLMEYLKARDNLGEEIITDEELDSIKKISYEEENDKKDEKLEGDTEENLEEKYLEIQQENNLLKGSLHDAESMYQNLRDELQSEREKYELEHSELAELKEVIFSAEEIDEEEENKEEYNFPYEVKKVTVVFGGHETWLKAIVPMLNGNIRFIDKDLVFDIAVVRNADIIWIQANAMSHKQYYRIIDAARQYRKPVRYFAFSSATKGAIQIMKADSM